MHIIQPLNFPTIGLTGLAMVVLLLAGCGGNESPDQLSTTEPELDITTMQVFPSVAQRDAHARAAALVNTEFEVLYDDANILPIQLVEVIDGASDPALDQFMLRFSAPLQPVLKEKTYRVRHYALGDFELFLSPGESGDNQRHYSSVFSLIIDFESIGDQG